MIQIEDFRAIKDVWDTYVKPTQDAGELQSYEMRLLMAVLRSMATGFNTDGTIRTEWVLEP